MKKDKKSSRSKIIERRHHKTARSHHGGHSGIKVKRAKNPRPRSLSAKRKNEEEKDNENPQPILEVCGDGVKTDALDANEALQFCNSFEDAMNDKEKMIQELFAAVCEESLKKITPDALKNCPLEELKVMCLVELNRMSNSEIVYILSGRDPTLFDPAIHSEETKEQNSLIPITVETSKTGMKQNILGTSYPSAEEPKDLATIKRILADAEQVTASSVAGDTKSEAGSDSLELCATQKEIDSLIQEEIINQTGTQTLAHQTRSDLTDMEILELELRARIIRSLLRSGGTEISDDDEGMQQKENVGVKERNT